MSRLFSQFPSVNDLLESAPLKGVVARMGRNRVVADTARFLDRMRVQAQSAAQQAFQFTTQELAQRVARWIAAGTPSGQSSVINATGMLLPSDLAGPPLATEAIDAMAHSSGAYQMGDELTSVSALVQRLSGYDATLVLASPEAAHLAFLSALCSGRELILRRGEIERSPRELPIDELARAAGVTLREVGAANQTSIADYEQAAGTNTAAVASIGLRHTDSASMSSPSLSDLGSLAARRILPLFVDLGWGGTLDLSSQGLSHLTSLSKAREAGSSIVLLRGHGTLGGPYCGLLAGRADLIERIAAHPIAQAARAPTPVLAALAATLELQQEFTSAERSIPFVGLLATSSENLKLRAERLAPQMAAVPAIASAEAIEVTGTLGTRRIASEQLPGWGIALRPAKGTADELGLQLLSGTQAIAARVEGDRIILNLRSVAPKYDLALVEAITALFETAEQPAI